MTEKPLQEVYQIDIEKVIAAKNAGLLKKLPGFVIRYLKRILHQEEINEFLRLYGRSQGVEFIENAFRHFGYSYEIKGTEHVVASKKYIFASNHPLGGLDGIAFLHAISGLGKEVKFLVNDILMNIENLEPLFVPINKHGSLSRDVASALDEAFKSEANILIFPAGLASRKIKGKIVDLEWKKNFISKAIEYQRDIVPVYINGKNSNFFYNLAKLRKFLGIKANIEMLYLPNEMFKQKQRHISIIIGKPVEWSSLDSSKSQKEWAGEIRAMVYRIANNR